MKLKCLLYIMVKTRKNKKSRNRTSRNYKKKLGGAQLSALMKGQDEAAQLEQRRRNEREHEAYEHISRGTTPATLVKREAQSRKIYENSIDLKSYPAEVIQERNDYANRTAYEKYQQRLHSDSSVLTWTPARYQEYIDTVRHQAQREYDSLYRKHLNQIRHVPQTHTFGMPFQEEVKKKEEKNAEKKYWNNILQQVGQQRRNENAQRHFDIYLNPATTRSLGAAVPAQPQPQPLSLSTEGFDSGYPVAPTPGGFGIAPTPGYPVAPTPGGFGIAPAPGGFGIAPAPGGFGSGTPKSRYGFGEYVPFSSGYAAHQNPSGITTAPSPGFGSGQTRKQPQPKSQNRPSLGFGSGQTGRHFSENRNPKNVSRAITQSEKIMSGSQFARPIPGSKGTRSNVNKSQLIKTAINSSNTSKNKKNGRPTQKQLFNYTAKTAVNHLPKGIEFVQKRGMFDNKAIRRPGNVYNRQEKEKMELKKTGAFFVKQQYAHNLSKEATFTTGVSKNTKERDPVYIARKKNEAKIERERQGPDSYMALQPGVNRIALPYKAGLQVTAPAGDIKESFTSRMMRAHGTTAFNPETEPGLQRLNPAMTGENFRYRPGMGLGIPYRHNKSNDWKPYKPEQIVQMVQGTRNPNTAIRQESERQKPFNYSTIRSLAPPLSREIHVPSKTPISISQRQELDSGNYFRQTGEALHIHGPNNINHPTN